MTEWFSQEFQNFRFDTFSAGVGIGRISSVRVTHLPTGMGEECWEFKSQIQNREKCLERLKARLEATRDSILGDTP